MTPWMKWTAVTVGVIIVLFGAAALYLQSLLSGSAKQRILASVSESLGVPVQVGEVHVSLGSLLKLEPTVALEKISVGNPGGYSPAGLLQAETVDAHVALKTFMGDHPQILDLTIVRPVLHVENKNGKTNFETFIDQLSAREESAASGAPGNGQDKPSKTLSINTLTIEDGSLRTQGEPLGSWNQIQVELSGFGSNKPLDVIATAHLLGSKRSEVNFKGLVGPITPGTLPAKGTLTLALAPGELPAGYAAKQFGRVFSAPGAESLVKLNAAVAGDLVKQAQGPAVLEISNLYLGRDAQHHLPVSGKANGTWAMRNTLSEPVMQIAMNESTFQLASGKVNSRLEMTTQKNNVQGTLSGSLSGLNIEQFLSAFAQSNPGVKGAFALPRFVLRFNGNDADSLLNNLTGEGSAQVSQGYIQQMDILNSITRAANRLGAIDNSGGNTKFSALRTDFTIRNQTLNLSNTSLDAAGLRATGGGTVGFNGALNLRMTSKVSSQLLGSLMSKVSGMTGGSSELTIPVDITGTTDRPVVQPNASGLAGNVTKSVTQGLLQRFLGKKK